MIEAHEVFMDCCNRGDKLDGLVNALVGVPGVTLELIPPHEGEATEEEIRAAGEAYAAHGLWLEEMGELSGVNTERLRVRAESTVRSGGVLLSVALTGDQGRQAYDLALSSYRYDH